jgi:hypothetical protein
LLNRKTTQFKLISKTIPAGMRMLEHDMGIDAGGWIEVKAAREEERWVGVIRFDEPMIRHYDMFGCLFDVMNHTGLTAPAPKRGLPPHLSLEGKYYDLQMEHNGGAVYQSWITWQEIQNVDLDEVGLDHRAHQYKRDEDGNLIYQNHKSVAPNTPDHIYEGMTWEAQGSVYKIQTITRREIFNAAADWQTLFSMIRLLEEQYKPEDIRVVIWFW